jgi:hypothetical protein
MFQNQNQNKIKFLFYKKAASVFRELCKLICNFLSIQFDENDNESLDNSNVDDIITDRTLTPKIGRKQKSLTVKSLISNNLSNKKNAIQLENNERILYEKRLNSLEKFATILEIPKLFSDLLKQFISEKNKFKQLKEVIIRTL